MEVSFHKSFIKSYSKRIKGNKALEEDFFQKLETFIQNPSHTALKTHKLSGKLKDLYSFSIQFDCRVVFYYTNTKPKKAVFIDIGNHDEVY